MISFRSMSLSLFALVAALAGCSAEAGTSAGANLVGDISAAVTAPTSAPQANAQHEEHRFAMHRMHDGPDFLIHAALREPINLTAQQRATIEALASKPNAAAAKPDFAAHAKELAAAVRSNTVESLQAPKVDESAREAHRAAEAAKLSTLHDTLTAQQRTQLVDAITKRAAERTANRGERVAKAGETGEHRAHVGKGRRFEGGAMHMLAGLDLTQAQKDAIKAKLEEGRPAAATPEQREAMKAQHEAMRAAMQAKLQSFKGDSFDAKAFVARAQLPGGMNIAKRAGNHRANELAIITSVLTPAQREQLAQKIEQGPRFERNAAPVTK